MSKYVLSRLSVLAAEKGLKAKDLAESSGLSSTTITKYLNIEFRHERIAVPTALALCEVVGCRFEELFREVSAEESRDS